MSNQIEFDVAITFAGPDRKIAEDIAQLLTKSNVKVFYDAFETGELWGEDLYSYLAEIYSKKARFCLMLLSSHYASSLWTNHERRFAQARAFRESSAYILPLKLDDTEIPGIAPTTAYIDLRTVPLSEVVALVKEKLRGKDAQVKATSTVWHGLLRAYADKTMARFAHQSVSGRYIPLKCETSTGEKSDAAKHVRQWLTERDEPILFLLGNYGTGKTTLCQVLSDSLSRGLLTNADRGHIPVFVQLRDVQRLFSHADFLDQVLKYAEVPPIPANRARFLLLLDGFDEILEEQARSAFFALLRNLLKQTFLKTLVTARTHYFKSQEEALRRLAVETTQGTSLSDVSEQTAWLNSRTLSLSEFDETQVKQYLQKVFPSGSSKYYERILSVYDLADLARRPILLNLIVGILPHIDEAAVITQDSIYDKTICLWLDREVWRGLDTQEMRRFMEALAAKMFFEQRFDLNFRDLAREVQARFKERILSRMDIDYFDTLVRTSGFLYRDVDGNFSFMHRSFMEFCFAHVLEQKIAKREIVLLDNKTLGENMHVDLSRTWDYAEAKGAALKAIKKKSKRSFNEAYSLSDGVVELLVSSLNNHFPENPFTKAVTDYVQRRQKFREDERVLHKAAASIRGQKNVDEEDVPSANDAFKRVMMIGGGGRIYYTVEHYAFSLFVDKTRLDDKWGLLISYHESWIHT